MARAAAGRPGMARAANPGGRAANPRRRAADPRGRAARGRAAHRRGRRRPECGGRRDEATEGNDGRQKEDGSIRHNGLPLQIFADRNETVLGRLYRQAYGRGSARPIGRGGAAVVLATTAMNLGLAAGGREFHTETSAGFGLAAMMASDNDRHCHFGEKRISRRTSSTSMSSRPKNIRSRRYLGENCPI